MGSAEISKNKTKISRYFGDLGKSLWQPLNIDVNMIFRSAYKYMHRTAQIFRTCSV